MAHEDEHDRTCAAVPVVPPPGDRHAFLLVLSGPSFGELFSLPPGRDLTVGRRDDADVPLRDDGVSRRHALVRVEGDTATVRDLGSVNGTWVNGKRLPEARIEHGARLHLGTNTTLQYLWVDELEARYQTKLAENAARDPLTALFNRRHFEDRLQAELGAAHRHGRALSVLLVDVDNFKGVNDRLGHAAGDEALQAIAAVLRAAVRKEDVLARWGGEEFVIAARETALAGARALAERIRAAVERAPIRGGGEDLPLTVSVGVAVSEGRDPYEPGQSERDLLGTADRALYLAKQTGRNRVVAVPPRGDDTRPLR